MEVRRIMKKDIIDKIEIESDNNNNNNNNNNVKIENNISHNDNENNVNSNVNKNVNNNVSNEEYHTIPKTDEEIKNENIPTIDCCRVITISGIL